MDATDFSGAIAERRQTAVRGLEEQGDIELLARLVEPERGQSPLMAAALLHEQFGGLAGLARLGPAKLIESGGLDEPSASRLAAALELGRRSWLRRRCGHSHAPLETPAAVAALFAPRAVGLDHERMWVVALDGGGRQRAVHCVARGGQHGLSVGTREILHAAIVNAASGFVLVHNHPSGDPTPSEHDIRLTLRLAEAADVVGVPLIDHVIVCPCGQYASMLDLELLTAVEDGDDCAGGVLNQRVLGLAASTNARPGQASR